jgi:uncharacterized protein YcfJ
MSLATVIPPVIDDSANGGLVQLAREASAFTKAPQLSVLITADAEGTTAANTRRFTLQVANRKGKPCRGLFLVSVVIGTSEAGGPGGGQTVATVAGASAGALVANQSLMLLTDSAGKVILDVTIAGAATLYPRAGVVCAMAVPDGGFSWT